MKINIFCDKTTNEILGVELPDKTIVLIDSKSNGLRVAFPRKKFWKIFKEQNKQKRKYLEVIFSKKELKIIAKVFGV